MRLYFLIPALVVIAMWIMAGARNTPFFAMLFVVAEVGVALIVIPSGIVSVGNPWGIFQGIGATMFAGSIVLSLILLQWTKYLSSLSAQSILNK